VAFGDDPAAVNTAALHELKLAKGVISAKDREIATRDQTIAARDQTIADQSETQGKHESALAEFAGLEQQHKRKCAEADDLQGELKRARRYIQEHAEACHRSALAAQQLLSGIGVGGGSQTTQGASE
jgi:hypothetical protein